MSHQPSRTAGNPPFLVRHTELDLALKHTLAVNPKSPSRLVVVKGDSGTGKSFFVRTLICRATREDPDLLSLYIDLANDEYRTADTISRLLKLAVVPSRATFRSPINVGQHQSPIRLQRRSDRRRSAVRGMGRLIARSLDLLVAGTGAVLEGAISPRQAQDPSLIEAQWSRYLRTVSRTTRTLIAIDNLQFLNTDTRLVLEAGFEGAATGVCVVLVDRTINGTSELVPPVRCLANTRLDINIGPFDKQATLDMVLATVSGEQRDLELLAHDVHTKTGGLPKDIEYCLREYKLSHGLGTGAAHVSGLLATIDRLPLIEQQVLTLASFLDGGIKRHLAVRIIQRLATVIDDASIGEVVDGLVAREYLRLNTESTDRLRPGHERVVQAVRDVIDPEVSEQVRASIVAELSSAVEDESEPESIEYLLHCLVGLQTATELAKQLHHIVRLVRSQHEREQFAYLTVISSELDGVVALLPHTTVELLLDAHQKNSAFERGLVLIHRLDTLDSPGEYARRLFEFKFLTQLYRYNEALSVANKLSDGEWEAVYRVNALQALERNDEARSIATPLLAIQGPMSEARSVLARNTVTLFDPPTAESHLKRAADYFVHQDSQYGIATTDTNRGLVCLADGRLGDALFYLERGCSRLDGIGSQESYQARMNLGVRDALLGHFDRALERFEEVRELVPRLLRLDQAKIEMNIAVARHCAGVCTLDETRRAILEAASLVRGLSVPYLRTALEHNIATAGSEVPNQHLHARKATSVVCVGLQARIHNPSLPEQDWIMLLSVHWRY